jgi:hypothetical protein
MPSANSNTPTAATIGTCLSLILTRTAIYASSGPGSGRQTEKRVKVVGEYEPNDPTALAAGSVRVQEIGGRAKRFDMLIGHDGNPYKLHSQRAHYDIDGSEIL